MMMFVVPAAHAAGTTPRGAAPATARRAAAIVGQVIDAGTRVGVAGAAVRVENTGLGAVTDTAGRYRILNVDPGSVTLSVRRIGYVAQRKTVAVPADGEVTADFVLTGAPTSLNEVIVTGTAGEQARREIPNAVSSVDASKVLSESQAPDMGTLLNSRAPGVSVVPSTGRLGAGPNIKHPRRVELEPRQ